MRTKSTLNLILTGLILFFFVEDITAQFNFSEVTGQPVLSWGDNVGDWDWGAVWHPKVIKDGDTFHMWYSGHDEGIWTPYNISSIGYASSLDGITWNKYNENPVLFGTLEWEGLSISQCAVILEADTFKMWYGADHWESPTSYVISPSKKIGYAWSTDGTNWNKHPVQVMEIGPASDWNDDFITPFTVIKEDGEYKMWYTAGRYGFPVGEDSYPQVGLATSLDGIEWTHYNDPETPNAPYTYSDPVMKVGFEGEWDSHRAAQPVVIKMDTEYLMFYNGLKAPINFDNLQEVGFATSTNGINWQKSVHNPILNNDILIVSWGIEFYNGTLLFYDSKYHYWFACMLTPSWQAYPQIGYAVTLPCPTGDITFNTQELIDNFNLFYPGCTEIDGNVYISGDHITNLDGLNELTSIGGNLSITSNPLLTSLSGLDSINPGSIDNLYIHDNALLTECDVTSICEYLADPIGNITISSNETGCNSQQEVEDDCDSPTSVSEFITDETFTISPNPLESTSLIKYYLNYKSAVIIKILDITGQEVVTLVDEVQQEGENKIVFKTSGLPAGIYFCVLKTNPPAGGQTTKMIKL